MSNSRDIEPVGEPVSRLESKRGAQYEFGRFDENLRITRAIIADEHEKLNRLAVHDEIEKAQQKKGKALTKKEKAAIESRIESEFGGLPTDPLEIVIRMFVQAQRAGSAAAVTVIWQSIRKHIYPEIRQIEPDKPERTPSDFESIMHDVREAGGDIPVDLNPTGVMLHGVLNMVEQQLTAVDVDLTALQEFDRIRKEVEASGDDITLDQFLEVSRRAARLAHTQQADDITH